MALALQRAAEKEEISIIDILLKMGVTSNEHEDADETANIFSSKAETANFIRNKTKADFARSWTVYTSINLIFIA
jgi:hypothetical protein